VAQDVAGIVDETDAGVGRSSEGPVGASEASETAPETRSETPGSETPGSEPPQHLEAAEAAGSPEVASAAAPRWRRIWIVLICAALALAVDTVSKAIVVANLQDRGPIHVPGGFLNLILIRNSGAAFSIGEGQTWVFTVIAAAVVFVILRVSRHLRSLPWAIALGLLLGGALGNLSDRLLRSPGVGRGDVVDFLQFPTFPMVHYDFPVFNLADTSIVIGGCLMVLLSFLGMQPDGTRHKDLKPADGDVEEPSAKDE
jgi:signal peptidase II